MNRFYFNKQFKNIVKRYSKAFLIFFYISQLQVLSNENILSDSLIIPKEVVNYAMKHNLQLVTDRYYIEKTYVENGNKYKYIYPCVNKQGKVFAILYKNVFYIKIAEPKALDILYIGTR